MNGSSLRLKQKSLESPEKRVKTKDWIQFPWDGLFEMDPWEMGWIPAFAWMCCWTHAPVGHLLRMLNKDLAVMIGRMAYAERIDLTNITIPKDTNYHWSKKAGGYIPSAPFDTVYNLIFENGHPYILISSVHRASGIEAVTDRESINDVCHICFRPSRNTGKIPDFVTYCNLHGEISRMSDGRSIDVKCMICKKKFTRENFFAICPECVEKHYSDERKKYDISYMQGRNAFEDHIYREEARKRFVFHDRLFG